MESPAVVPINYLRQVADQLVDLQADAGVWLATAGLREADLADGAVTIPLTTFFALMDKAIEISREPGLGLLVGRRLMPGAHGVVGMAAQASASIREAMQIAEQFARLRTGAVMIRAHAHDDRFEAHVEVAGEFGAAGRAVIEAAVVAIKNVADEKTLHRSVCDYVAFSFAEPAYASLARDILACEVRYGQTWSGLSFPADVADQTVSQHDALVLGEALRICDEALRKLQIDSRVSARLERLLLERKPSFPPLDLCARLLGMAPRTLHRRLGEEGTSYREVLDTVKHRIARECLGIERMRVKEVAYLLGYNDVANFRRAFKRWEGVPPSNATGRSSR